MFGNFSYYPDLKISPSEIQALEKLPGTDKDLILPIIRLRRWLRAGKAASVFQQIDRALGPDRPCILDVIAPGKETCEAEIELNRLLEPQGGYANWVDFISDRNRFIPVLQVIGGNKGQVVSEVNEFVAIGRGLAIRLRRKAAWDVEILQWLREVDFAGTPLLVIFDYGQIQAGTDIALAAAILEGLVRTCLVDFPSANIFFTIAASSFPVNFAEIHRETYRLPIRERQLFGTLSATLNGDAQLKYGDCASVFAGERGFARGGAPRIDLPKQTRWIYHRKETGGFESAATAIISDNEWDDELIIWGTERIRDAASGELGGMTYARAWTAVRIHLHLHQQANFGASVAQLNDTDEAWED